jgi:PRC-barrel domain
MKTKLLAIGLLSSTLLASIAIAQRQPPAAPAGNAQPPTGSTDARPADGRFITQEGSQGVLRLTDVIGQNAVGTDNKTIGEIEDVVLGHDGKVAAYIVKVSGTPGIGSRAVAVPVHAVEEQSKARDCLRARPRDRRREAKCRSAAFSRPARLL